MTSALIGRHALAVIATDCIRRVLNPIAIPLATIVAAVPCIALAVVQVDAGAMAAADLRMHQVHILAVPELTYPAVVFRVT